MEEIKVFAPATVANVACGYDMMGFAMKDIGDTLIVKKKHRKHGKLKMVLVVKVYLPTLK